jgi:hypothetical protein
VEVVAVTVPDRRVVPAPSSEQPDIDRLADTVRDGYAEYDDDTEVMLYRSDRALDELVALARDSDSMALANELATVGSNLLAAEARVAELERHRASELDSAMVLIGRIASAVEPRDDESVLDAVRRERERVAELEAALRDDPERIARMFHETYERLAPEHGYETRRESAVPWEDVPENNLALMVAVAAEVGAALAGDGGGA